MRPRLAPFLSAVLLASGLVVTAAASPSAAAGLPDLKITEAALESKQVAPGESLPVTETVKNVGKSKSGRSATKFWLSTDQVVDGTDTKLAGKRAVGKLRPGRASKGTTAVTIPVGTAAGRYWVLVCADATKDVRERKERNNCAPAGSRLTVATVGGGDPVWSGDNPKLRVFEVGSRHLSLVWPAARPGSGVTEFVLTWDGGTRAVPVSRPEATITQLSPGTEYTVSVQARRADGTLDPIALTARASTAQGLQAPLDLELTTGHPRAQEISGANDWSGPQEIVSEVWLGGTDWEYELKLPNGAAPSGDTIRMAEVTGVEGLATTGGLVAGVQLEPSGLLLAEPAILEIRPRSTEVEVPVDVIPLVFEGDGQQAHLISVDPTSQVYRFQISHFSGVVVMEGTDAERDALVDNAESEIDRLANENAAALAEERRRMLESGDDNIDPAVLDSLETQFEAAWQHARTMLQAATTNDRIAQRAVSTAMGLLRSAEMVGVDVTAEWAEFTALLDHILQNAYDASKRRCEVNLDPREAARMIGYGRSAQMLGASIDWSMDDVMTCAATKVELDIDGDFATWDVPEDVFICCGGAANSVTGNVKASVELSPTRSGNNLYYVGVADPVLSGLAVERVRTCSVSIGAPGEENAIPLVLTAAFNWDVNPDAPARYQVQITDFTPTGEELPYFRTTFAVTYVPTSGDGCGNPVTASASVWNSLPLTYGGVGQPWTIPVGTTTYTTAADPYPRLNFGGDVRLSFTLSASR